MARASQNRLALARHQGINYRKGDLVMVIGARSPFGVTHNFTLLLNVMMVDADGGAAICTVGAEENPKLLY